MKTEIMKIKAPKEFDETDPDINAEYEDSRINWDLIITKKPKS